MTIVRIERDVWKLNETFWFCSLGELVEIMEGFGYE